jgi:hypothetical protein
MGTLDRILYAKNIRVGRSAWHAQKTVNQARCVRYLRANMGQQDLVLQLLLVDDDDDEY